LPAGVRAAGPLMDASRMGRSPSTFRQTDITRALKAIRAAGYSAVRVLIDKAGRIEIATTTEGEAQGKPDEPVEKVKDLIK
jgi:hypothetical protein